MMLHEGPCDLSCWVQIAATTVIALTDAVLYYIDRYDIRMALIFGCMVAWAGRAYVALSGVWRWTQLVEAGR